jgi:general secretion pathway protein D
VSSVIPTTTSSLPSPTIQQRRITTTVSVRDGETLALGGMIQEQRSRSNEGLPFLSRIPLIGGLFGSDDRQTTRSELVVLLTPHVIRTEEDSAAAMADFEQEFRALHRAMPGLLAPPPTNQDRSVTPKASGKEHGSQQENPPARPNP